MRQGRSGRLVWTGTLPLLYPITLTAATLAELVERARQELDEIYPDQEPIPMRIFIVPDALADAIRPEEVVEVTIRPLRDHPHRRDLD